MWSCQSTIEFAALNNANFLFCSFQQPSLKLIASNIIVKFLFIMFYRLTLPSLKEYKLLNDSIIPFELGDLSSNPSKGMIFFPHDLFTPFISSFTIYLG